jgi:hypothetical protein
VRAVILVSVLISACTTFLTMRQSQKRGMMNQGPVDPDNPMAQSQKFMVYIAPLFALSGLYWQYGLVIYWVTNNLWTMGQQHFLFRNLPVVDSATVGAATAPASGGGTRNAAANAGKVSSGSKSAQAGKTSGTSRTASAAQSAKAASQAAKPAQPARAAQAPKTAGTGANGSAPAPATSTADQGGGLSGLLRLGKSKAEPEPEVAPVKTVRQQPVRQTRNKRSGNKR